MELGFALNGDDNELYSILSRTVSLADSTAINATLTQYSAENAKSSFMDLITDNPAVGIIALTLLLALLIIIFEQQRIIRAKKEIKAKRHEMADLNKRIYTDRLTSVRNRDSFSEYIKDLQKKLDDLEPTEFAMAVFDCNGLNMINDKYGYEKGNEYIKAAANLICRTFKSSPVFRIEGDEFAAVLQKEDYENRRDLISKLEADQKEITASAANEWESVDVAIGLAEYNPRIDQTVGGTYRRAERLMYKEKPNRKYN